MAHVRKQCITFFLTAKCNLNCRYCYARKDIKRLKIKPEHQTLNFNFAKRGLQDFFRDYPSRHIRFYGVGEPTIEFELMKKIKDYAYELAGEELIVELQTNGYFSEKIREWIAENVDILWLSIDGPPEIQDMHRPTLEGKPSSKIVEKNLKFFAKQKHMQVGVRSTVSSFTIRRQIEIVEYFAKMGIKYVNAHPACVPISGNSDPVFQWEPIEFAKEFLKAHNKARELGVFYNSLYIANFDEKTRHACRACIPYPQLTTDGYVSCCDFATFGPKYMPGPLQQLVYGKYIQEEDRIVYDEEKIFKIRSRCAENLEKEPCKNCKFLYYCAGGCLGQVVNETGNIMGIHKKNCKITKYLAERMELGKELWPVLHS